MKIGIIGSGQIGGTLTRRFRTIGLDVRVANSRGPDSLADLARETGAIASTREEVVRGPDLVVLTIPLRKVESLPSQLFANAPSGQIVVDTCNYYPRERDGRIAQIEEGLTESGWVQQRIGHRVVKVFNSIYATSLMNNGKAPGTPGRIALPVAGDDPAEKAVVMELLDRIGFDAVDTGTIDDSWRQQPATPVYTQDLDAEGVRAALQQARPERPVGFTATSRSPGSFESPL